MSRNADERLHTAIAQALLDTFRPRMNMYAERLDTERRVKDLNAWMEKKRLNPHFTLGGWKPAGRKGDPKPLTLDAVVDHVRGRRTLGFYPTHPDGTANSISVDFDNHRGASAITRDPREDLDALMVVCQRRGVRFLANTSRGGKGYWLHIFPTVGTPARVGRAILLTLIHEAGLRHVTDGGTFDAVFPKQDDLKSATVDNPGNLFCVPLAGAWLRADPPGSHFLNTDPADLSAQLRILTEY